MVLLERRRRENSAELVAGDGGDRCRATNRMGREEQEPVMGLLLRNVRV